jgi:hypothetical protein
MLLRRKLTGNDELQTFGPRHQSAATTARNAPEAGRRWDTSPQVPPTPIPRSGASQPASIAAFGACDDAGISGHAKKGPRVHLGATPPRRGASYRLIQLCAPRDQPPQLVPSSTHPLAALTQRHDRGFPSPKPPSSASCRRFACDLLAAPAKSDHVACIAHPPRQSQSPPRPPPPCPHLPLHPISPTHTASLPNHHRLTLTSASTFARHHLRSHAPSQCSVLPAITPLPCPIVTSPTHLPLRCLTRDNPSSIFPTCIFTSLAIDQIMPTANHLGAWHLASLHAGPNIQHHTSHDPAQYT